MANEYRNHNCGELNINNVGQEVRLAGWIQRIRNLGGMTFIDLRDQYGITQITISDESLKEQMSQIYTECVISVDGKVLERSNKNNKIPTGEIEVEAKSITILGKCEPTLPFEINSEKIDTIFSELPILNNIDKNNALNDTINGNKNFLNTFFREAK